MKILIINYEYPPLGGGGGIETKDLAVELAKKHEVHVLTTAYRGLPAKEVSGNVIIHRVPVLARKSLPTATLTSLVTFFPAALIYGLFLLPRIRPDIINSHFVIPSGLPAVILSTLFRVPFVLTLIGGDIYDPSKGISPHRHSFLRFVIKRIMRRADKITAISHDTKERAIRYYNAPEGIEVIPLGFVPPILNEKVELKKDGKTHYVSIGRLVPRKGYFDLLKAFSLMKNKKAELHIIGDGPLLDELRSESDKLGIASQVVLHGRVDEQEKYSILKRCDVYVSASHHEGFGICFLEAMHAGLPIISTNIGGQTDFLVPGKNAYLVPVHDIEKISLLMDKLAQDEAERRKMGDQNGKDVENYYIENTTRRYELIFNDLLEK